MFNDVLPFDDVEGGSAEVLGHFAEYLKRLFDAVATLSARRSIGEWEQVLLTLLDTFFQPAESQVQELLLIRSTLRALASQAAEAGYAEPVDLAVILESLNQLLEEDRFGSGFITGGVTFCALKPMRSIPFKVIALIGMNDNAFPRTDRHLSFDLMAQQPRLGDRSLRVGRPLSLPGDAALGARAAAHQLRRPVHSRQQRSPAVGAGERAAGLHCAGIRIARRRHSQGPRAGPAPPAGFQPGLFHGADARLFSYSAENCRASHCGQAARALPASFLDAPLSEPEAEWRTVDVAALGEFFCNPATLAGDAPARAAIRGEGRGAGRGGAVRGGALDGYAIRQDLVELGLKGSQPQRRSAADEGVGTAAAGRSRGRALPRAAGRCADFPGATAAPPRRGVYRPRPG